MRAAIGLAIVVGAVKVFRKDIARIAETLRGPVQNFVKEVRHELESDASKKLVAGSGPSAATPASSTGLATSAAEAVKATEAAAKEKQDTPKLQ